MLRFIHAKRSHLPLNHSCGLHYASIVCRNWFHLFTCFCFHYTITDTTTSPFPSEGKNRMLASNGERSGSAIGLFSDSIVECRAIGGLLLCCARCATEVNQK